MSKAKGRRGEFRDRRVDVGPVARAEKRWRNAPQIGIYSYYKYVV